MTPPQSINPALEIPLDISSNNVKVTIELTDKDRKALKPVRKSVKNFKGMLQLINI